MALPTASQLSAAITAQSLPSPSVSFLTTVLSNASRLPPDRALVALTATAKHRLISSDLTTPSLLLPSTPSLPSQLSDVRIAERLLPNDVFVQVLDVEDLSRSLWEQVEALEAERKGETTKGREIIRVVASAPDDDIGSTSATQHIGTQPSQTNKGPYKVLLQDWKGSQIYGFELRRIEKIGYPPHMSIGCKVLLKKGAKVARGVVLLDPSSAVVFGGKVEALDKAWTTGREKRLRDRVKQEAEGRS